MSRIRPEELVVRCSLRDAAGAPVDRVVVRVPAVASAGAVLEAVLRLALAERRRGRVLMVDEPAEVAALLALAGFGPGGPDLGGGAVRS